MILPRSSVAAASTGALVLYLLLLLASPLRAQNTGGRTSNAATGNTVGGNNQARGNTGTASTPNSSGAPSTLTYRNNNQLGNALIQIDPETRSLIIVADDDTEKEIIKVIRDLDKPKPQVLIKVLFAQVTLDNNSDLGVEGNYSFNVGSSPLTSLLAGVTSTASGTATTNTPSQNTTTTVSPTGKTTVTTTNNVPVTGTTNGTAGPATNFGLASETQGAFFRLDTRYAAATLYALAQKGKVSILSRPSILARNNQEAAILIGQSVPLPSGNVISDTGREQHQRELHGRGDHPPRDALYHLQPEHRNDRLAGDQFTGHADRANLAEL